ncbi:MAG: hypothetical protein U0Q11_11475 [Vicinamibacterales bacterium]
MSQVPPPAPKQDAATNGSKPAEPHRVVWRGVETTAEATDATRQAASEHKSSAPTMWRGHEVSAAQADALKPNAAGQSASEHKTPAKIMWRGHEVTASAVTSPTDAVAPSSRLDAPVTSPAYADAHARETWRDAPQVAAQSMAGQELSNATSLDDLFKAILGDQAGDVDDRALLLETVEAQVRGIRDELGLPEPVIEVPKPAPAPVAAQAETVPDRTLGSFETAASTKRTPGLFKMVAGLALGRFSHS